MKHRIISIPWMGEDYTRIIASHLTELGLNIQLPPKTTDKTVRLGVRNSANMICYPYKQTLGNFIEALDQGANTLLMYDSLGRCKFRHYWIAQEFTLRGLGYDFDIFNLNSKNILRVLSALGGKSRAKVLSQLLSLYKEIREKDEERHTFSDDKLNIGMVGEVFSCCDERANYHIARKVEKYGAKVINTVTLSDFIAESLRRYFHFPFFDRKRKHKKQARKYLNGPLGGHGFENIYNSLWLADKGVDGLIHIAPLSCSPESMVEPYIDEICRHTNTPLLRVVVDENQSEVNLETRVETFVELIKWNK